MVAESANRVGAEWSTVGVAYGQPAPPTTNGRVAADTPGCLRYDERVWLDAPRRFALTVTRLGQHADPEDGSWGLLAAVHPAVHALRVTTPGSRVTASPRSRSPNVRTVLGTPRSSCLPRPPGPRSSCSTNRAPLCLGGPGTSSWAADLPAREGPGSPPAVPPAGPGCHRRHPPRWTLSGRSMAYPAQRAGNSQLEGHSRPLRP